MKNLNTIIIEGHLGRDAEFRVTSSGISLAKISVAVNRPVRDESSETGWKEVADWFDCVAWGRLAEVAANCYRGQAVIVRGRMIQEHWEDATTGQKRTNWKLQVEELYLTGSRVGAGAGATTATAPQACDQDLLEEDDQSLIEPPPPAPARTGQTAPLAPSPGSSRPASPLPDQRRTLYREEDFEKAENVPF